MDGNRFAEWLRNGLNQGRSGHNPPPPPRHARLDGSDEAEEEVDDESATYLYGDAGKENDLAKQNGQSRRTRNEGKDLPRGVKRVCTECKRDIGDGRVLARLGTYFHPWCFCCHACGRPITELEFSLSGSNPFHKSCLPKCDVCGTCVHNRIGSHPFWSQKYCLWHEIDDTPRCRSCGRLQPWGTCYITLRDGWRSCLECMDSAVLGDDECQQLYRTIVTFYEGLNLKFDQKFPVILQNISFDKAKSGKGTNLPNTCGMISSEHPVEYGSKPTFSHKGNVMAIILESGYPRLVLGANLARMLMWAWLHIEGYNKETPELKGVDRVISYTWLESQVKSTAYSSGKGMKSEFERKLGEYLMYRIANNDVPVSREAFCAANAAVKRYGLRCTLNYVRVTGTLPS